MNQVAAFDEIAAEFHLRVSRIVWCTLATVDPDGMPWTRVTGLASSLKPKLTWRPGGTPRT